MPERFFIMPTGLGSARLYDRNHHGVVLAELYDPEIAARIVRLLNADVARTEKQGAVAP